MEKLFDLLERGFCEKICGSNDNDKISECKLEFSLSPAMNMPQVYHKMAMI
jgi:hypothetical protein